MQQAKQTPSRHQPRSAAAGRVTRTAPAAEFTDRRPAAIAQRKLAEAIKGSPRTVAQRALISAMHDGSHGTAQRKQLGSLFGEPAQLAGGPDEELLQGKFSPVQRQGPEEEDLLQGKLAPVQREGGPEEEALLQGKFLPVQRQGPEEEEMLQGKFAPVQRAAAESAGELRENKTGLPDNLKVGIESLSGMSLDQVKVHYNSAQPAQLNALAYAQGSDIHVAPGQEQHLPHEAWHVVQQAQGRVKPTMQMKDGVPVNDDAGLEHEADVMGTRARSSAALLNDEALQRQVPANGVIQAFDAGVGSGWHIHFGEHIKYASNNATRVNFGGRTRRVIGYQLEQAIQENGLAATKAGADFSACKAWIRSHIA